MDDKIDIHELIAQVSFACEARSPNQKAAEELQRLYDNWCKYNKRSPRPKAIEDAEYWLIEYYEHLNVDK